jgi:diketogulonate reductase-like aldo/keto reductase
MKYIEIREMKVPVLGLGTWDLRGQPCTDAVLSALDLGYRHVDTAQMYANEERIGEALLRTDVPREDIFLTTKIMPADLAYHDVLQSFAVSLDKLQTDYVDLLLIHWPSSDVPVSETIKAMNELQEDRRVKHIGVSNFSVRQTREAMDASRTPVCTNQVHYDPFRGQSRLLEFCIQNDIMLTAYSPLAKGRAADNSKLREIGEKYGKTAAQVTLRWLIQQHKVSAIPKAGNPDHQRENLNIFDFELSREDMERIFELQGGVVEKLRSLIGI